MPANTGFQFYIQNSDGTQSTTKVDMADMFTSKDLWYNAGLWGCGYNVYGQLGNGTTTNYSSPIQVGSLTNWKQVSGHIHSLGIKTDGTLWAYGYNVAGQLGNGTTTNYSSPVQIGSLSNWKYVSCSYYHSAAIKTDGTLWTCGYNTYGQLGNGTTISYSSPIQVGSSTNWKQVACGYRHTAAVKTDGSLWSWGFNYSGQLGYEVGVFGTTNQSSPVQIAGGAIWSNTQPNTQILTITGTDSTHIALIGSNNSLWVIGKNDNGQLGIGSTIKQSSPVQVGSLTNWKQLSVGGNKTMAVKTDGTLWGCGYNGYGELGNGNTTDYSSPIQIGSLTNWKQVSCCFHVAAVKTDGTLWTWGRNNPANVAGGQLGDGTTISKSSPVQIGALTNWSQVACGYKHVLAVKTNGTLWAWGDNDFGQLGNGSNGDKYSSPIQIGALTNWSQVSGGYLHSAAIKTDGTLWTWGQNNTYGQLGNGTTDQYSSPIQVGTNTNWKLVAAGTYHTAAVKTDGTLWTWGNGGGGIIGNNGTNSYSSPVQIGALTNWTQIVATGSNLYGYTSTGYVYSWGYNSQGQLGYQTGALGNASAPQQVGTLTNWKQVDVWYNDSMAVKNDGTLWSWGSGNSGQLGLGNIDAVGLFGSTNQSSPVQVAGGATWSTTNANTTILSSAIGYAFNAIKADGTLWTCGVNAYGGLGDGTTIKKSSPVQVGSLTNWKQASGGNYQMLAVKTDGTLWGWGYNLYGQLGNGTRTDYSSPIQIGSLTNWAQVYSFNTYTAAVKTDGTLWTWGDGYYGQLGVGSGSGLKYSSPVQVGSLTNWKQVSVGNWSMLAVKTDGTLWGWGENSNGNLGNGTTVNYSSPVQIGTATNWKQVSTGYSMTFAVKTDGTLWAWGWSYNGGLGNGTTLKYSSPVQIGSLSTWNQVACGYYHGAAVKTDGTVWTWGYNYYGSLGNGTTTDYSSPIQVGTATNWSQVACGLGNVIGYKTDGTMYSWGYNNNGQLAALTDWTGSTSSPIQVGSLTNWKQVSTGYNCSLAVKNDGTLWTWGGNAYGQLGNGATVSYSSPIQVGSLNDWKQAVMIQGGYIRAVKTNGTLWACGYNTNGQLGNGTTIHYSSPIQIGSLNIWKYVSRNPLIQAPDLELNKYAPGAPSGVTVTTINSTAVSVSFTAPSYTGNDPVTSYEVSY